MTTGFDTPKSGARLRLYYALLAIALLFAIVAFLVKCHDFGESSSLPADFADTLSPAGVTLTMIGQPVTEDGFSHLRPFQKGDVLSNGTTVFADSDGKTFYTFDKDVEGKPACVGGCLADWPIATVEAQASPVGDWSVVARPDGRKQWAFRNKPLYTSQKDHRIGDANGSGLDGGAWHPLVFSSTSARKAPKAEPVFEPANVGPIPFDIAVHEVDDADGWVLTDNAGRTLYFRAGQPKEKVSCAGEIICNKQWVPLSAPALAQDSGRFTIVTQTDGTRQWAYEGQPLFRNAADVNPGQCNGLGVDAHWKPAVVVRFPMPAPVALHSTQNIGKIFTTADGRSLYRQFIYYYSAEAGDFAHGYPYSEIVGRLVGADGCTGECTRRWQPFAAAPNALPGGHWTILTRADGTRQWAYKGYALYTYDGDKKPLDLHGLDIWDTTPSDPSIHAVSFLSRLKIDAETVTGVVFTTVYP